MKDESGFGAPPGVGDERRREERVLIDKILQSFIMRGSIFLRAEIEDISRSGIAFLIKKEKDRFEIGDEVKMKVFLKDTDIYFLLNYKVIRVVQDQNGLFRHSGILAEHSPNFEAIGSLVDFIKTVNLLRGKSGI